DGQRRSAWLSKVRVPSTLLRRHPIIENQTWQRTRQEGPQMVRLMQADQELAPASREDLINVGDKELRTSMEGLARRAGFTGSLQSLVANRLTINARPTFTFDPAATAQAQNQAEEAVRPVV